MGQKIRLSNLGSEPGEYKTKYDWDCSCQSGANGIVFSKGGNYRTAFFEAFPNNPKCFIRGEGETVEAAEQQAWDKYQKIQGCNHEMERRDRTDGYGFCKHCSYSVMVFEPLTKCCKCGKPTRWTTDYKGRWYCKFHARNKPKERDQKAWEIKHRLPRKIKKMMKYGASWRLYQHRYGKIKADLCQSIRFSGNGYYIPVFFKRSYKTLFILGKQR